MRQPQISHPDDQLPSFQDGLDTNYGRYTQQSLLPGGSQQRHNQNFRIPRAVTTPSVSQPLGAMLVLNVRNNVYCNMNTIRPLLAQSQIQERTALSPGNHPPSPKRRRVGVQNVVREGAARESRIIKRDCNSDAGSHYSECCSSCPDGIPCAEPDCEEGKEELIPCTKRACEKAVCTDSCLGVGIEKQQVKWEQDTITPVENILAAMSNSSWDGQASRSIRGGGNHLVGMNLHAMIDPNLASNEDPRMSTSASPVSATLFSSGENTMSTPASFRNGMPTPLYSSSSFEVGQSQIPDGILTGAGTLFGVPGVGNWQQQGSNGSYNPDYKCFWTNCGQMFPTHQNWIDHIHRQHVDAQMDFNCPIGPNNCSDTIGLNPVDHLQTSHGMDFNSANSFSCPAPNCFTDQIYLTPSMLHNHFDQSHATPINGLLSCHWDTCGATVGDTSQLFNHLSVQHQLPIPNFDGQDIDLTDQCGATTSRASVPDNEFPKDFDHLSCQWKLDHHGVCGTICKTPEDLQNHVKDAHLTALNKDTGYICHWENCGRLEKRGEQHGFSQRGKLERHMATHTGYKCCACDECGVAFSAPQALRQHKLLHTGEKPWPCRHCNKRFPQQSARTVHERTHTLEKPLICEVCHRRFSESSNLAKHRKTHGEKGRHPCTRPNCGKSFHRLDQLKRHYASHDRGHGSIGSSPSTASHDITEKDEPEH